MITHLQDKHNNKLIKLNNEQLELLKLSLIFRIQKHREFIEKDQEQLKDYFDVHNVALEIMERISERLLKISELKEFAMYSLDIDLDKY